MDDELTAEKPERLARLEGRTVQAASPHYTRFVRIMRLALPLLALMIVGVVAAWPNMDRVPAMAIQDKQTQKQAGSNELIKPHYEGEDSKGQPFVLTADRAVQSARDTDVILLDQPRGRATLSNGTAIDAAALKGAYRQKAQRLMLEGGVRVNQSQGYHFISDRLMIDMQSHKSWTDSPVSGDGPAGSISATGMQASQDDGVLIFTGPAKLILKRAMKGL